MKKIIYFLGVLVFFILSSSRALALINCGPTGSGAPGQPWFCTSGTCLVTLPSPENGYYRTNALDSYCTNNGLGRYCCVDPNAILTSTPTPPATPTVGGPPTATPAPCEFQSEESNTTSICIDTTAAQGTQSTCNDYGFKNGSAYTESKVGDGYCQKNHGHNFICCVFAGTAIQATATAGAGSGSGSLPPTAAITLPTIVCSTPGTNGSCNGIQTGVGLISTDAAKFINSIFTIILSISGGIALILIIVSGYQLSLSSGNPEKVKEAQGMLTAAIVGFIFIIFSVAILQIIGVDILGSILPTFGK